MPNIIIKAEILLQYDSVLKFTKIHTHIEYNKLRRQLKTQRFDIEDAKELLKILYKEEYKSKFIELFL